MRPTAPSSLLLALALAAPAPAQDAAARPNVVVVITDDQGWGDFGFHGNPVLRTPSLDRLAAESARAERFYVSPVCAPTRAALMTGRWCQRTRAIDTYIGRAMLEPEEVTVAEVLREAGYATGLFGKWHLGDCHPMRPQDQGFDRVLMHRGGGIGQPSDPEGAEGDYTDAVLFDERGAAVRTKGYCTDVYFDHALEFMATSQDAGRPFFAYVATNAPHGPFHDVPEDLRAEYAAMDLDPSRFPQELGHALPESHDEDRLARVFAMIENVDANVGRLTAFLGERGLAEDTIVVFLLDNGPNTRRFVGGMRGKKGDVYEGGIRSPLFVRWPARLEAGVTTDRVAAHVDLLPTLAEACGAVVPEGVALDGRSLLPLLAQEDVDWPDRELVIQAHRGDVGVRYQHFAMITQRWKLVSPTGFGQERDAVEDPPFELYDLAADPRELVEVSRHYPDVLQHLVGRYDAWFDDVSTTRPDNWAPPRIHLGGPAAREVHLTRQDWRRTSDDGGWRRDSLGHWEVRVVESWPWTVRVRFPDGVAPTGLSLRCGPLSRHVAVEDGARERTLEGVRLPPGDRRFEVELREGDRAVGALQVMLTREGAPE